MNSLEKNNRLMRLASFCSVSTAFVLMAAKGGAFLLTGSMAILSGLFDSVQDALTSLVNLIAVKEATTPADAEHRFGHGKAQALGGLTQSIIILIASFFLLKESALRLFNPQPIHEIGIALTVTAFALILSFCLVCFQKKVVAQTGSLSIKADLAHYTGDVLMNIGIGGSIILSYFFNWHFIDALFGILVALYLFCSIAHVIKDSLNMLMDREVPEHIRREIKKTVCTVDGVYDCFDLKTRLSGNEMFVQFSVALNDKMDLTEAHNKVHEIEKIICAKHPTMKLIIHPEPVSELKHKPKKLKQAKLPRT